MSSRNYGIYQEGAIFHKRDFDPVKVILAISEKINQITLPDNILNALNNNEFNLEIAAELCELLQIQEKNKINTITDYSYISNNLLDGAENENWFDGAEPLMGTEKISVLIFSNIEADFYYDNDEYSEDYMENVYMFSLYSPLVWNIQKRSDWETKDEIVRQIRETAKTLLKDGIDWENRLGHLIGSSFG